MFLLKAQRDLFQQFMVDRANQDPSFAEQLVKDLLKLKEENEMLKDEVAAVKQMEREAQQALRQARGISSYLKGKQGELRKTEKESLLALRQANGISSYLKSKNESLENKLKDAERIELEAQQALRQARGVSAYLKSKNASLEKKLAAAKSERSAQTALNNARKNSLVIKSSIQEKDMNALKNLFQAGDDSEGEDQPSVASSNDETSQSAIELAAEKEAGSLSINDKVGMLGLVIAGVIVAMR